MAAAKAPPKAIAILRKHSPFLIKCYCHSELISFFFILSFWSRLSVKHSEVAWLLYDNVALIYDLSIISGSDLTQKSPQTRQHLDLRRRNFCDKESIITKQNPDRNGTFTMNQLKEELEIIRLSIGTEYSDFRFVEKSQNSFRFIFRKNQNFGILLNLNMGFGF